MYKYWNVFPIATGSFSYIIEKAKESITITLMQRVSSDYENRHPDNAQLIKGVDVNKEFGDNYYLKYNPVTITLDSLRNHAEWKDYSIWCPIINTGLGIVGIVNKYAESFPSRRTAPNTNKLFNKFFPIDIIVPSEHCNFDEVTIFVYKDPDSKLISNVDFVEADNSLLKDSYKREMLPLLTLDGPSTINKDSYVEFTVNVGNYKLEYPLTIEVANINGYVPKTRIETANSASFKVYSTGLEVGDTIKVKAGFRYYSSLAEKEIEVV